MASTLHGPITSSAPTMPTHTGFTVAPQASMVQFTSSEPAARSTQTTSTPNLSRHPSSGSIITGPSVTTQTPSSASFSMSTHPVQQYLAAPITGSSHDSMATIPPQYYDAHASLGHQNQFRHQQIQPQTSFMSVQDSPKPQIYSAVYSGIAVYEMEIHGLAVMRRRHDSWLNATQILKLAGVEKGKRTKVLEREILSGEHEKIQGGYGKFQGTWISYDRGAQFARNYGVEELMRPLLEYDMGQDGQSIAGSGGNMTTPTKEQAMAAQRKRNTMNGMSDGNALSQSRPNGTFFQSLSKSAANAVDAINKARLTTPDPRNGIQSRNDAVQHRHSRNSNALSSGLSRNALSRRHSSQQHMEPTSENQQDYAYLLGSQQSIATMQSEPSFNVPSHQNNGSAAQGLTKASFSENVEFEESPRKRVKSSFDQNGNRVGRNMADMSFSSAGAPVSAPSDVAIMHHPSSPSAIMGYVLHENTVSIEPDPGILGLAPLKQPISRNALEKQQLLSSLFFDPTQTDFSSHPALLQLSGEDLDIPIDQTAHTALHWAATLARISLLRALTQRGASIFRLNGGGETALIRASLTTNNLDQATFPELLEILGPTMEVRDGRGRTVLHHIAVSSAVKGPKRSAACRYYLESLLEYVVRSGSSLPLSTAIGPSNSEDKDSSNNDVNHASFGITLPSATTVPQSSKLNPQEGPTIKAKPIGLARFMSDIVNAQDLAGDTALNLAARVSNRSIIQQLLEVGANPMIANSGGLRPVDFGVTSDLYAIGPSNGSAPDAGADENKLSSYQCKSHNGHADDNRNKTKIGNSDIMVNRVVQSGQDLVEALRDMIATTCTNFIAEMRQKQSMIEATHIQLRESTALLTEERRRFDNMQERQAKRQCLAGQIETLNQANQMRHVRHEAEQQVGSAGGIWPPGHVLREDVRVGEADAGLEIDVSQLPRSTYSTNPMSMSTRSASNEAPATQMTPSDLKHIQPNDHYSSNNSFITNELITNELGEIPSASQSRAQIISSNVPNSSINPTVVQRAYLSTLPGPLVLRARADAYRRLNDELEKTKLAHEARSTHLEAKLRRVVCLCTGVPEDKIDEMLDALSRAVDSECDEGIEVARVREFLRKVESGSPHTEVARGTEPRDSDAVDASGAEPANFDTTDVMMTHGNGEGLVGANDLT